MLLLFIAFIISLMLTIFIVRFASVHQKYTADNQPGPQKIHFQSVSRAGGFAILFSLMLTLLFRRYYLISLDIQPSNDISLWLILCILPVFVVGFAEDITKKVGIWPRLIVIIISSIMAYHFLTVQITHLGIPGTALLFMIPFVSLALSVFAMTGLTNAYNLIDGLNGLASMVAVLTLLSIAYVSFKNSDPLLLNLSLIMIGAIAGFFIWNYPFGLIFLGDGGAYLIGFYIALLSILVVQRHPTVSPLYALVVNAYPIFETLFTIWRRKIHRGRKSMIPDGIHFHTLIYRRVMRWATRNEKIALLNNAKSSPYLWALSCVTIFPATLWWDNSYYLIITVLLFCVFYILCYRWIVRFKSPLN